MEKLNKYSKEKPFKVPESYFDSFEDKLFERIESEGYEKGTTWKIASLKPFIAVAAGFLLLFSFWFLFLDKLNFEKTGTNETNDNEEVLYSYFELMDTDELILLVAADDTFIDEFVIDLEKDIDYLIEDLDESFIMEEIEIDEI